MTLNMLLSSFQDDLNLLRVNTLLKMEKEAPASSALTKVESVTAFAPPKSF